MTLRIALISEHASPLGTLGGVDSGGQNVYVGQLARHLASQGYSIDIFTRRDSPLLPETAEWLKGIRIVHVPAGPDSYLPKEEMLGCMDDFVAFALQSCRRQRRPYDIVHANFWMSGLVACEIKRRLDIPFVVTFHALGRVRRLYQQDADRFPDERFQVEDRIIEEADHIIAECPQDEEDLIRLYNADPSRITIIPCGFDPGELSPMSKELARVVLGLSPDERVILHSGRMVARKGVDNVIRGFARLRRKHGVEARLMVAGGDRKDNDRRVRSEVQRLEEIAEQEGVAEFVHFAGWRNRDALKYFYSAADIFVTTPWYEPFGITPVEAMACGTPVVGSNVGGIKFSVRDGETGYLIPPNDTDALAERLAHLYHNPKLLKLLGRQATRRANDLFTWQRVANSVAELYETVLRLRQPERRQNLIELATLDRVFTDAQTAFLASQRRLRRPILAAAQAIDDCFATSGKLLVCGNGGSAADSQHFVAELVGRFKAEGRPALPALALTADSAILTAWSNDVGYETVYARQIEALGRCGDLLVAISTSGRSASILRALEAAQHAGLRRLALLGCDGGEARGLADIPLVVPHNDTQRIQEVQLAIIHLICELVEERCLSRVQAQALPVALPASRSLPRRQAAVRELAPPLAGARTERRNRARVSG